MNTAPKLNSLPPMLQQYVDYKSQYADCLLFFQVGDFYEVFFEDAVTVAKTLNLTLTSRDKNSPDPVPMCGVPIAVIDPYADRLVEAGFSVAIVSQTSAGAAVNGSGKGMMARSLERIITPGIKILGNAGNDTAEKIVVSVFVESINEVAIAFSDVQTAKIFIRENQTIRSVLQELSRINPAEIILPTQIGNQKIDKRVSWVAELAHQFSSIQLKFRNDRLQPVDTRNQREYSCIKGYSALSEIGKKAVRLLLNYVDETTVSVSLPISEISQKTYDGLVSIDATSRSNLELVKSLKGSGEEGTLFALLNRTATAGGAKVLRQWILAPLTDVHAINERQEFVAALLQNPDIKENIRTCLKYISDLERIAARLELQAALPKELAGLRDSLQKSPEIQALLSQLSVQCTFAKDSLTEKIQSELSFPSHLLELLEKSLADKPEGSVNYGGIIKEGVNEELDRLRNIKSTGQSWIAEIEARERQRSGINSLKIKYNNVLGYFIEVTAANSSKVPADFIRRQSTANTERYTTEELRIREKEVLGAEDKQILLEKKLYEELRQEVGRFVADIRQLSSAISLIDVLCCFAEISDKEAYVRPQVDNSNELVIIEGKHPVLAQLLGTDFVPTALSMYEEKENFFIITGPNMGGKSTYLRQAALLTIMAQIGCFVPAKEARIGIVDKIFARLGASDNQIEGESTFMVEMREASFILASASSRSLVLIDEIGRGTATADGLAIARAILEWIVLKVGCRTLFATHFHELTALEGSIKSLANYSVGSFEKNGHVLFTHEICKGPASKSYGIEVARLAGLPAELLKRARELLVERNNNNPQLSIFSDAAELFRYEPSVVQQSSVLYDEIVRKIRDTDINNLSPIAALNFLNELKRELTE